MYISNVNGITRITIKQRCLLNRKLYKGKTDFLSKHLGYRSNPLLYEPRKKLVFCCFLLNFFFERLQLIRLSSESVADGNNDDDNNNDDNGKNNNNDDNDDNNADNNNNDNNDDEFRSTGFPRFLQH